MKQIAVLFEGNIHRRLGVFNAVINRVKHLQQVADYQIDVHLFQVYDGWLMRRLRHSEPILQRPDEVVVDGVTVHVCWFRRRWTDVLRHRLLHRPPKAMLNRLHRLGWEMRGHDLVSAHDRIAAHAAVWAGQQLHIPCFITWHGASIYTDPPRDPMIREATIDLLQQATCNFFVSQGLLDKARELATDFKAQVLLNGANGEFAPMAEPKRGQVRQSLGVTQDEQVVAFVGRFEPVKNVLWLPAIFKSIQDRYHRHPLAFWAIGDGVQLAEVQQAMREAGVNCHFMGKQPPERMPELMACIDLLVLPSSLEGLPLVAIEALASGAHVVATDVIGTAEAVGKENAIALGEGFIERFAQRAVVLLQGEATQQLPAEVSWEATARKENAIYHQYLTAHD